jgi:hypothetical protein
MIDSSADQKMNQVESIAAQAKDSLNKIDSAAKK